ncbi:hypothetical protein F0U44_04825 [Nocardioides humilatus]|uniref:HTH luxR-type domain-containing protein n=1 Tax=Nocardioides humilatus TaxID=2607660 RepID=A0A5B1LM68_9ACTN|nr:helix-turn-helix transcriptional regulator [Nocardioides humilatus]KAA1421604.1 hypothetical protein F0U44_04825 [Nocardioides humilatus]
MSSEEELELLLWLDIQAGDYDRAYAALTRLLTVVEEPVARGRLETALGIMLQRAGLTADARESYSRALALIGESEADRAFALAMASMASALVGELDVARAEADEAAALGESAGALFAVGQAHVTLTIVHLGRSRPHEALAAAERAVAVDAEGPGQAEFLSTAHVMKGMALAELDRLEEAYAAIDLGIAMAQEQGDTGQLAWYHASLALLHFVHGSWEEARAAAGAALDHATRTGALVATGLAAGIAACVEAYRGNTSSARELITRGTSSRPGQFGGLGGEWVALATAATADDADDRFAALCDAWFRLRGVPYQLAWKVAAHPLIVAALDRGDVALAEAVERRVAEGAARAGDVASARATALVCRGSLLGSRDLLEEGVALLRTSGRPLALGYACREAGHLAHAAGDTTRAVELLNEAADVFHALGATTWSASVTRDLIAATVSPAAAPSQSEAWSRLTGAERRVAELVIEGKTNRQIAAELGLSPRTVQSQLASASERLGVGSRVQLAALLAQ